MTPARRSGNVIPVPSWIIAGIVFALVALILMQAAPGKMKPNARAILLVVLPGAASGYVLAIGYVYGDARRRGMRYVLWTLLATFLFWGIGIILYFILREPPAAFCSKCGKPAAQNFAYCPHCGSCLQPSCPVCRRVIEGLWSHCAWCGTAIAATAAGQPARMP